MREISSHRFLVNAAGLFALGIDEYVKEPPGGSFCRRPDGKLTGEIVGAATVPVWQNLPRTSLSYAKTVIEFAVSECHRYGITSVQEASATTAYLRAVRELEAENRLPLDISAHIVSVSRAIEAGKIANFIVVDRDLSQGDFAGATVLKTWFEGRQVYSSVSGQVGL